MSAAEDERTVERTCEVCQSANPGDARFCKACGASMAPPPACPACDAEVPEEARFCPGCGARLVGARPAVAASAAPAPVAAAPAPAETPAKAVEAALEAEAKALPTPRRASSNVGSNVLLFVAILMVLLVGIYQMNKDAEKEVSPFQGGPPPAAAAAPSPTEAAPPPAAPAAAPVRGVVKLGPGIEAPAGTLFVILRNAGVKRGPPLAVKKVTSPSFPYSFEVGAQDVMMKGMPFTGPFDIQARVDADGNAMTKAPGDVVSAAGLSGVEAGDEVEVLLDKRL